MYYGRTIFKEIDKRETDYYDDQEHKYYSSKYTAKRFHRDADSFPQFNQTEQLYIVNDELNSVKEDNQINNEVVEKIEQDEIGVKEMNNDSYNKDENDEQDSKE